MIELHLDCSTVRPHPKPARLPTYLFLAWSCHNNLRPVPDSDKRATLQECVDPKREIKA